MADNLKTLLYLDPLADDRAYKETQVRFLRVNGSVLFEGAFAAFYDRKQKKMRYIQSARIFQVDFSLSAAERQQAIKEMRENKWHVGVVYYWKLDCEIEDNKVYVFRTAWPGTKPYGFECVIAEIGEHWVTVYNPTFKDRIVIPRCRVVGIEEHEHDGR